MFTEAYQYICESVVALVIGELTQAEGSEQA